MAKTIKVPIMNLEVQLQSGVRQFTSPVAETILAQVRNVKVGREVINWFDEENKEFRGDTFCCGDYYKFFYVTTELQLRETEVDCYGFPITYIGDEEGSKTTIENGVVTVTQS